MSEELCNICLEAGKLRTYVFPCTCRLQLHATCEEHWRSVEKDTCPLCKNKWNIPNQTTEPQGAVQVPVQVATNQQVEVAQRIHPPNEYTMRIARTLGEPNMIVVVQRSDSQGEKDAMCACCFCFCCIGFLLLIILAAARYVK